MYNEEHLKHGFIFVSVYRLFKCTSCSLVLPLLLKTTSLVCKVLLVAFTKLRKINSLVALAREWMLWTAAKLVTMSLVSASVRFLIVKPLLGCTRALEDQVLEIWKLKSFLMEKWIWLHRQSTDCVAVFMLLMLCWHIFTSHVKISRDWKINKNQFTCRLIHLIISSAIKLRLVPTYSLLPVPWGYVVKYIFVHFMLWKLYINGKCGSSRDVIIQEGAVVCQKQNLGRWKSAVNTSMPCVLHGDVLQKK